MKKVLALSALTVALVGCQSTQTAQQPAPEPVADCYYYGNPDIAAPSWICSPNANQEEYIREAVGFSGDTAGGIAHQKNLAILQAQKELADQVKLEILTQVKSKVGTLGVGGSAGATSATSAEKNAISNVVLEGVETIKSFRGKDGYFYVHVGLPRNVFQQNVERVIAAVEESSPETIPESAQKKNADLAEQITQALGDI
ncbi:MULTISPECIES: LPP20 family lipoprotein [Vibrio]|uniref:LPP20 family lipoprotein n=1 Tax=Vibrio cortegadensis TaxID=1328770 RepID=A0ABV4M3G1_9VIBR|nr:LPP20 family lipoprotein [Vibrio cortegadensis]MDN3697329.1 LPP20 family lipoprotein [Vibrio cortegadensis]